MPRPATEAALALGLLVASSTATTPTRADDAKRSRIEKVPPGSLRRCGPRRLDCVKSYETLFNRLSVGPAWLDGDLAIDTRLELGVLVGGAPDSSGFVGDLTLGLRRVEAPNAWAISAPLMSIRFGYHYRRFILTGGIGIQYLVVDEVDGNVGAGILVPEAQGALELDLDIARIGVLGHADYRWQWGASDFPTLGVTGTLSWVFHRPEGPSCSALEKERCHPR